MKGRLALAALAVTAAALAATTPALGSKAEIRQKQAEAERVLAEIDQIDQNLELAVEAWNRANLRLGQLQADIRVNRRHLEIARQAYRTAQTNLADRLVTLYTSGGELSVLEVMLGAASLDDLLDRVDSAQRISTQDVRVIESVRRARDDVRAREKKLERALAEQQRVVADRASRRASIERQLGQRQELYSSIEDQVEKLQAEEAERQRRLREEAERRLAALQVQVESVVEIPDGIPSPDGIGTAPPSQVGGDVVSIAMQYLGVQYVWGGASPSGFDCSGLVVYVYAQMGISLPHYTGSLWQVGVPVSSGDLQPGDLVFFHGLGHMGIYIGGGQMIHAPHTGDVVKISDISSGYYASSYVGARRVG